jgi:NAD-dependent dihydropyrimidine dehydrogenase PreA subunit
LREQINWHPTIVPERCVECGLCATSCGRNVYAFDYEANKPVVVAPQACMAGCTACATICTQAKNMLRADPEKYDGKIRAPVAG